MTPRPLLALPLLAASALVLAGCTAPAADPAADGVVRIVTSTNVYGDIAQTVGGADVEVTSIIDSPDQDPHEFEANARVQLALSRADIIVENGGGYDDFMGTMLDAAGNDSAVVLDAVALSGKDAEAEGFNEHVWYDYPTVQALAAALAGALAEVDSAHAADYADRAADFGTGVDGLITSAAATAESAGGAGVVITEPVPGYLLEAMRLDDLTPPEFSGAIEDDTDVPPALLQSVLNLIGDGSAAIVVYNAQTGGPQTDAIIDVATDAQVPAIGVTETLPAGLDYLAWQTSVQQAISTALAS